jgi:hypothetical protein
MQVSTVVAGGAGPLMLGLLRSPWSKLMPTFMSRVKQLTVAMNQVSAGAAAPAGISSVFGAILGKFWPPTKQNRVWCGVFVACAVVLISFNMRSHDSPLKDAMISKKKKKAVEALEKVIEEARKAKPASPQAEEAAGKVSGTAHAIADGHAGDEKKVF